MYYTNFKKHMKVKWMWSHLWTGKSQEDLLVLFLWQAFWMLLFRASLTDIVFFCRTSLSCGSGGKRWWMLNKYPHSFLFPFYFPPLTLQPSQPSGSSTLCLTLLCPKSRPAPPALCSDWRDGDGGGGGSLACRLFDHMELAFGQKNTFVC